MKKIYGLFILPTLLLSACGEKEEKKPDPVTPEIIHHFGGWELSDEHQHKRTCADDGCGEVMYENHRFDKGFVTKAPTHMETGEKVFTCEICGFTKTETIQKIGPHSFNQAIVSEATKKSDPACDHGAEYYLSCECGAISDTETFQVGQPIGHDFSGNLKIKGDYTKEYVGGDTFDFDSLNIECYCEREGKDVAINKKDIAFEYSNGGFAFECEDVSIEASLIADPTIKVDIPVTVNHKEFEWVHDNPNYPGFDTYECTACNKVTKTFPNVVKNIHVDLSTQTDPTIDLTGVDYEEIVSIKLGTFDLGTDPDNLDLTAVRQAGFKNYNASKLEVIVLDEDDESHTLLGNGYVIDKINYVSTVSELEALCVGTNTPNLVPVTADNGNAGQGIKGYYLLENDITVDTPWNKTAHEFNWSYANNIVFDGDGHKVSFYSTNSGIFNNLCYSTLRNCTFEERNYTGGKQISIIGKELFNSTVENCNFICKGSTNVDFSIPSDSQKGAISYGKCANNKFVNCLFDYSNINVTALLCTAGGCTGNSFSNTTFICDHYVAICGTQGLGTKFNNFDGLTTIGTQVDNPTVI